MADELNEGMTEEVTPVVAEEEVVEPIAEEGIEGTVMTHTVDEIPALAGLAIGDEISFRVANVSEDGNTFDLEVMPPAEVLPEEEIGMEEEIPVTPELGREEVTRALL